MSRKKYCNMHIIADFPLQANLNDKDPEEVEQVCNILLLLTNEGAKIGERKATYKSQVEPHAFTGPLSGNLYLTSNSV